MSSQNLFDLPLYQSVYVNVSFLFPLHLYQSIYVIVPFKHLYINQYKLKSMLNINFYLMLFLSISTIVKSYNYRNYLVKLSKKFSTFLLLYLIQIIRNQLEFRKTKKAAIKLICSMRIAFLIPNWILKFYMKTILALQCENLSDHAVKRAIMTPNLPL